MMNNYLLLCVLAACLLVLQGCTTTQSYAPDRDTSLVYNVTDFNDEVDVVATFCPREPEEIYMVMPEGDGKVGIVDITFGTGEQAVIEGGYSAIAIQSNKVSSFEANPDDAKLWFGDVVSAMPEPALYKKLYFRNGSTSLTAASKKAAKAMYGEIKKRDIVSIVIEGYTDTTASKEFNEKLSLARAQKVSDSLVSQGVELGRIRIIGFGENNLVVKTADNVSEQKNRRVEINIR
jgi:outer membrane protein OmpA-like peptidoglycan-associated protein